MSFHFLGHHLLRAGVVTQGQLDMALAHQATANRRLGDLAVERGLLTPGQVQEILSRQREADLSFGMLAVSLGYVSKRDMDALLFRQQVHLVHLGEALLTLGFLTPEQFCEQLNVYAAQEKAREAEMDRLFAGHCARTVLEALVDALEKAFLRFAHCPLKAQGRLPDDALEAMPLHHSLDLPLAGGAFLRFTLHLGTDMLAVLGEAARRNGRHASQPDDALQEVLDILGIIGRYLCSSLDPHALPPPACSPAPTPASGEEAPGAGCLRMLLACPAASVGLTVGLVPNNQPLETPA
jgi:hypothetical protein